MEIRIHRSAQEARQLENLGSDFKNMEIKNTSRLLTIVPNTKAFQLDLFLSISPSAVVMDCRPPPKPPRNSSPELSKNFKKVNNLVHCQYIGVLGLIQLKADVYLLLVKNAKLLGKVPSFFNSTDISIYQIKSVDAISLSNDTTDVLFKDLKFKHSDQSNATSYSSIVGGYIERLGSMALGSASESNDPPLTEERLQSSSTISDIIKYFSNGSFYFSHDINMTRSFQDSCTHNHTSHDYDDRFLWNRYILYPLIERTNGNAIKSTILSSNIFLYVISGFVYLNRTSSLCIISRLGCYRAGTRFLTRGVDDDGHVANYVETELVYHDSEQYFSLVQIRGSVPIFWEQQGLQIGQPKIQITRSFDASEPAFSSHFDHLIKHFGRISIINLLSLKEGSHSESILARCYEKHVKMYSRNPNIKHPIDINDHSDIDYFNNDNSNVTIDYHSFDFHSIVKESYDKLVTTLLRELDSAMNAFGYFVYDIKQGKTLKRQTGVFRINCLDCLDRTNVVQSILSRCMLKDWRKEFRADDELNTAWADNGDALSVLYTGTGALKSGYTRTGKRTISGFMDDLKKTTHRFYINNFQDKFRQKTIDWILGRTPYQERVALMDVNNQRIAHIPGVVSSTYEPPLSIYAITWNVNTIPSSQVNLTGLFHPICKIESPMPDMIVIGLQEMIELNPQQLLGPSTSSLQSDISSTESIIGDVSSSSMGAHWEQGILTCINHLFHENDNKYIKLSNVQLAGIYLLVIGKKKVINEIRQVETSTKKTGFGGVAGNKGSVAIRFTINNRSIHIINSHFASGQENATLRNKDYQSAWNNPGLAFPSGYRVCDHRSDADCIIWLGDMNYRIQLPSLLVQECIASRQYGLLLEYDQLKLEQRKGETMVGFTEENIIFPPTYKYYRFSEEYDVERVPGWTDRILYRGQLTAILYGFIDDCIESDHRPVAALLKYQRNQTEPLVSL